MRYTKRCQHGEKWDFYKPEDGVYIRLESDDKPGTLGRQICKGGGFMGSTLMAHSRQAFERAVDKWVRNHRRNHREMWNDCYLCGKKLEEQ